MARQSVPHDHDAERSVLGAAMLEQRALDETVSRLRPEDFHDKRNRECFDVIRRLAAESKPVDEITVAGGLSFADKGAYTSALTELVPTAVNVSAYIGIVREKSARRGILEATKNAALEAIESEDTPQTIADRAAAALSATAVHRGDNFATPARDLLRDEIRQVERLAEGSQQQRGIRCGYYDLDSRLGGYSPGSLNLIAARPSMGKTALATNVMVGAALRGAKALMYSLEMNKSEVAQRILAAEARVNLNLLRNGKLDAEEWSLVMRAANRVHNLTLDIATPPSINILELRAQTRMWRNDRGGLDMLVIDYLQLMKGSAKRYEREESEISEISQGLKALARELDIPVIALVQLNRQCEARPDKRPMLSDLRGSGSLEQDADTVTFIYRDEYYHPNTQDKGEAEIIIAKNRNGARGGRPVLMRWSDAWARFDNALDNTRTGQMSMVGGA